MQTPANSTPFLSLHTDFSSLARDPWDTFLLAHNADLYMSYDFCHTWWNHYHKNRTLRLFIAKDAAGQITALLPMFIETLWLGPIRLRWAKLLGSDFLPAVLSPCLPPPHGPALLKFAIDSLLTKDRCTAISLGPLSNEAGVPDLVRAAAKEIAPLATLQQDAQTTIHTTFHLPDTFDAWLSSLNKRQKTNLKRDINLFAKNFKTTTDTVKDGPDLESEFANFRTMHDAQWKAENKLGHFGDWPKASDFNLALLKALAPLGRVRLTRLWANDQVASYQYSLAFGNRLYWRLPARLTGEEWNRFGMGRLGLVKMIEASIAEGINYIEGGPGHYDYKVQLGGIEVPIISQVLVKNSPTARAKWSLFQKAANLLHLAYYRAYFLKLRPKLNLPQRPLNPLWIRTRH